MDYELFKTPKLQDKIMKYPMAVEISSATKNVHYHHKLISTWMFDAAGFKEIENLANEHYPYMSFLFTLLIAFECIMMKQKYKFIKMEAVEDDLFQNLLTVFSNKFPWDVLAHCHFDGTVRISLHDGLGGIYLGKSPQHGRNDALILDGTTGLVSRQFHV